MLPVGDNFHGYTGRFGDGPFLAYGTILFILALVGVHLLAPEAWRSFGFVPATAAAEGWMYVLAAGISSVFVHSGWLALLGNCLYLGLFGWTLERVVGTGPCVLLFPLLGLPGALVEATVHLQPEVPQVGAAGAVSVIMGIYLALSFGLGAKIRLLTTTTGFNLVSFWIPAWLFLASYEVLELAQLSRGDGVGHAAAAVSLGVGVAVGTGLRLLLPDKMPTEDDFDAP